MFVASLVSAIVLWVFTCKRPVLGLVLCILAGVVFLTVGIGSESVEVFLLAPLVPIIGGIVALTIPVDAFSDPKSAMWARRTIWSTLIFCAAGIVVVVVHAGGRIFSQIGGLFLAPMLLACVPNGVVWALAAVYFRSPPASVVISTLAAAMRQNMPLSTALESAATGRNDSAGRIMRRISRWLVQGYPLSEAIRCGYPRFPRQAYGMILAAEKVGQLPNALEVLDAQLVEKALARKLVSPIFPWYPVVLIALGGLVLVRCFGSIMARLVEGLEVAQVPLSTRLSMAAAKGLSGRSFIWALSVILLLLFSMGICRSIFKTSARHSFVSRLADWIKWHTPVWHRLEHHRSMIDTVGCLRLALLTGLPLDKAIEATQSLAVNHCLARRIRAWLGAVRAGQNVSLAARKSGLGTTLAWAFDNRLNPGNTMNILQMLEEFYRSNYRYMRNIAMLMLWPFVTLVMGCMTGIIAHGLFSLLVLEIYQFADFVP